MVRSKSTVWRNCLEDTVLARDNMLSPVRPSVCLSVRPSVTRVDQSKTVEVRIMQLSPRSSPVTLVFSWLTSPRNSKGNIGSGDAEWETGRKNMQFLANKSPYLRNGAKYDQGYCDGLIGSRICAFDWHQGRWLWMTLNCCKFKFARNFVLLHIFGRQQRLNGLAVVASQKLNAWR